MGMLTWPQHQPEATPHNTSILISLLELAAQKWVLSYEKTTFNYLFSTRNL